MVPFLIYPTTNSRESSRCWLDNFLYQTFELFVGVLETAPSVRWNTVKYA